MSKMQNPKRTTVAPKIAQAAPKRSPVRGSLADALSQQRARQVKVVPAK